MAMKKEQISFKDLKKTELESLKDTYVLSRVNNMTEHELRLFVKEVLDVQVKGTVGNQEEKEVWEEMRAHFSDDFESQIKSVIQSKSSEGDLQTPEEKEFIRRIELLEQQKRAESNSSKDMW